MGIFSRVKNAVTRTDSEQDKRDFEPQTSAMAAPNAAPVTHVEIGFKGVQPVLVSWGVSAILLIAVGIAIWGIFHMASAVQWVLVAVFLAGVITALLNPLVRGLSRIMPRGAATGISLIGFLALFLGIITWIVTSVAAQWESMAEQMSRGLQGILEWVADGPLPVDATAEELSQEMDALIDRGIEWLQTNAGTIATSALSQASAVFLFFTLLSLAIFCSVFFMATGRNMWLWFINLLPSSVRLRTHAAASAGWYTFSGYARGTIIIGFCDGVLAFILLLACGVPLAAPLAVLVFIGAFIPIIGAPLAMIVAALVALATQGPVIALVVLLGVALIGQVEGHLLQPIIMGHQVSLHPVVIALAVTGATFVAGILGAILVIPLISIIWEVYKVLRPTPDQALKALPRLELRNIPGTSLAKQLVDKASKDLNEAAEEAVSPVTARPASEMLGGTGAGVSLEGTVEFEPMHPDSDADDPSVSQTDGIEIGGLGGPGTRGVAGFEDESDGTGISAPPREVKGNRIGNED
ncbi:AI-2E family transporter [uncultured Actinobaculum sp.]|uniref:AI-2E family transporter n=1 Tax=uncultured Actinobaculum sp. TaxID=655643 RepID=UPI00280462FA|nr:AI-2E family transporter [uncultured Actinobaculum sp.]